MNFSKKKQKKKHGTVFPIHYQEEKTSLYRIFTSRSHHDTLI